MLNLQRNILYAVVFGAFCLGITTGCSDNKEKEIQSVRSDSADMDIFVSCPSCRKRISYQEFKDADMPNMKVCPQCKKLVPKPLLLRQTIRKKR